MEQNEPISANLSDDNSEKVKSIRENKQNDSTPAESTPMTDSQKLSFLVRNLEGGNASMFGKRTGIDRPALSHIKAGERRLTGKIDAILAAYPSVRREWLETGVGYAGDISVEVVRERLNGIIAERDRQIATLLDEIDLQKAVIRKLLG